MLSRGIVSDSGRRSFYVELVSGFFLLVALYLLSRYNYLLFHSIAEGFSIVVACGIFMIAWNTRAFHEAVSGYLPFLGVAYLSVGVVDFMHAMAYKGLGVFPYGGSNLATQFWIAGRLLESVSLLVAPFMLGRRVNLGGVMVGYAVITAVLLSAVFGDLFPVCYVEGEGLTAFKVGSEYLISFVLALAGLHTFRRRDRMAEDVSRYIVAAIALTIVSEFTFTLYNDVYGILNAGGHFLKIVSFYLVYKAVIQKGLMNPYSLLFRELKEKEVVLAKSEQYVRTIVDTVGEGIIVVDARGRIQFVNQELCDTFGYVESELTGNEVQMIMPEKHRRLHRRAFERHLKNGASNILGRRMQIEGLHKKGRVFPIDLKVEEAVGAGDSFFIAAIRDITDRKRWEEDLQAAKTEAEGATMLKDKFVSLVSHDLRGPIGSLRNLLTLVREERTDETSRSRMLSVAERSCTDMEQRISDLLKVGRMKTGKIALHLDFVQVRAVTDRAMEELRASADAKGVTLKNDVPEEVQLYADEGLFYEVVGNLLSNAVKFSKGGDAVTVHVPNGAPSTIAVSDNGTGVSPDIIDSLFEYEVKTSHIGTAGERGSGLGLPLCRDIVEAHGGKMSVESVKDAGSTFYVTLPEVKKDGGA